MGATTVMRSMTRRARSSAARRRAKVVLPAPGVATARKSRGISARYCSRASACQARSLPAVPQAARSGKDGERCSAAEVPGWEPEGVAVLTGFEGSGGARHPRTEKPWQNGGMVTQQHPWSRYVALGDSFTEGIGDPEPAVPAGTAAGPTASRRCSARAEDFAYANLAVRGKLIQQIIDEQVEPALGLHPDLITISAGGNDVIRPRTDPDEIAARFEYAIERLCARPRDDRAVHRRRRRGSPPCSGACAARSRSTTRTSGRSRRSTTASSPTSGR